MLRPSPNHGTQRLHNDDDDDDDYYEYYMSRLAISYSFLVYCHLKCSLDGILLNFPIRVIKVSS